MSAPQAQMLADGKRLHLQHGPIDLIIEAFGQAGEVQAAYRQAWQRFKIILGELADELPALRGQCGPEAITFESPVAARMSKIAAHHLPEFVTPMICVAGAVADEILRALIQGRDLEKAYVNNGGDIAFHLGEAQELQAALAVMDRDLGDRPLDRLAIPYQSLVRGMATSGWRGRSCSLGIADSVTVLARTAAEADAAATLIANAVDLPGHPAIRREAAERLQPDSDLGQRLATTEVGPLSDPEIARALEAGLQKAEQLRHRGLIEAAALFLQTGKRLTGDLAGVQIEDKRSRRYAHA